jgi:FkbM family methyltransferase
MSPSRTFTRNFVPRTVRNWLRTPSRTVRYLVDRAAFACGSMAVVDVTDGWSLKCHPASRAHFEVFRTDPLQAEELAAFFTSATLGMHLLDIGAHYGIFALAALRAGGPDARVLCVEPSANAVEVLRANLEANRETSRVQVVNAALGNLDGRLRMLTTGPAGADYLVVPSCSRPDTVLVKMRFMKSVLEEAAFRPTHIKLDIEGYEFEVIEAALDILSKLQPILHLELHGTFLEARGKNPADVIANLRTAGYRSFLCANRLVDERLMALQQFNCRLVCRP